MARGKVGFNLNSRGYHRDNNNLNSSINYSKPIDGIRW
jgi:hypothetical protein